MQRNRFEVIKNKPEIKRSNHGQTGLKVEPNICAKYWDNLWLGVKG